MSEIRSISEGTFVIGDTNGLTFEAGPGISVSQPSEGTVRIANDETVLYENSNPAQITGTANFDLSEPYTNFNYIKLEVRASYGAQQITKLVDITNKLPNETKFAASLGEWGMGQPSDANLYCDRGYIQFNEASASTLFASSPGSRIQINPSGNISFNANRGPAIFKVIGINRISGSNA